MISRQSLPANPYGDDPAWLAGWQGPPPLSTQADVYRFVFRANLGLPY